MSEHPLHTADLSSEHDPTDAFDWENIKPKTSIYEGKDPSVNDDINAGYDITSMIIRIDVEPRKAWILIDPTPNAAVWERIDSNGSTGGGADVTMFELIHLFKTALLTSEAIATRNIDGFISQWDVWKDDTYAEKLFTQTRSYTDGRITQKITRDEITGSTLTVDITIVDDFVTKIVRTITSSSTWDDSGIWDDSEIWSE